MNIDNNTNQGVVPNTPASQPAPVQTSVQNAPASVTPEPYVGPAPVTTNPRTQENFEKLLESNNRLFEANQVLQQEILRRAQSNQQFAPIQQVPQPPVAQDLFETDPVTGESTVNQERLNAKLSEVEEAKARATRAEQAVQSYIQTNEQREIERQNRETFTVYPDLDPTSSSFNKEFHNRTRQLLQDAYSFPEDYGGRPLTFKEAADRVHTQLPQPVVPADPKADTTDAGQALKEQASSSVSNQPAPARTYQNDDELQQQLAYATRRGDDEALAIRLKFTDHVRQASEEA